VENETGRRLYILALDHRGSLRRKLQELPDTRSGRSEFERMRDAKLLTYEGAEAAVRQGADIESFGVLVDAEHGSEILARARALGMRTAAPVERSGSPELVFEHGEDLAEHVASLDLDLVKVLIRYNPAGDPSMNERQLSRLVDLSAWTKGRREQLLVELLVPAESAQLEAVGGSTERYDAEIRPALMVEAIARFQDAGVEADVWKLEGLERSEDCRRVATQTRRGHRDDVVCVILGRGADAAKVDHWLRCAAPVEGFIGFAIGRSVWWGPLQRYLEGSISRTRAADEIAGNFLRFVSTYESSR
jgi:myo-inositol catabolism protein IolC